MGADGIERLLRPIERHALVRHRLETLRTSLLHGVERLGITLDRAANAAGACRLQVGVELAAPLRFLRSGCGPAVGKDGASPIWCFRAAIRVAVRKARAIEHASRLFGPGREDRKGVVLGNTVSERVRTGVLCAVNKNN